MVAQKDVGEPGHCSVSCTKSAKIYQKLWTKNGSPLLHYSRQVEGLLQQTLGDGYTVHLAMRYKNPSIPSVLEEMRKQNYKKIIVLPMFPQYASASTGSAHEEVMRVIRTWWVIPEIKFISQYFDHPTFIDGLVARGNQYNLQEYDHILFSYHGLPERQVDKVHLEGLCSDHACEKEITEENKFCYKAT